MAYTNDQRMAFVMQRAQGKSFDKIADDLGITKQTLIKWQGENFTRSRRLQRRTRSHAGNDLTQLQKLWARSWQN